LKVEWIVHDRVSWTKYVFSVPDSFDEHSLRWYVRSFLGEEKGMTTRPKDDGIELIQHCPVCPSNSSPWLSFEDDGNGRPHVMLHIPASGPLGWDINGEIPSPSWDPFAERLEAALWGNR
jgi:hypothetical protein